MLSISQSRQELRAKTFGIDSAILLDILQLTSATSGIIGFLGLNSYCIASSISSGCFKGNPTVVTRAIPIYKLTVPRLCIGMPSVLTTLFLAFELKRGEGKIEDG